MALNIHTIKSFADAHGSGATIVAASATAGKTVEFLHIFLYGSGEAATLTFGGETIARALINGTVHTRGPVMAAGDAGSAIAVTGSGEYAISFMYH